MSAVARQLPGLRGNRENLGFAVLLYRRPETGIWTARSVLTGHMAHAETEEGAMEALQSVIDVSIHVAGEHGRTASDWLSAQRPDREEHVVEFCRLVAQGSVETTQKSVAHSGCVLEVRVGKRIA